MKRTPAPLTKYYAPTVLWREDLDEIVRVLASAGCALEIVSGEYSFDIIDELANHFGTARPLTVLKHTGADEKGP